MAIITESIKEINGLKLHIVKTEKYKTNTLVWKMKAPLTQEDVTKRALLPYVLQSSSEKYPTTIALRSYLDDLYGASFFVDLAKKGDYHIISFSLEIANEKFLSDPTPLLRKSLEFLADTLQKPNAKNGEFDQETVENEKRSLKQRIQSVYNDKMKYSTERLVEEMYKGDPYALSTNGKLDDVDSITSKDLFDYYKKAFAEDELDLYVIGDVDGEEVQTIVSEVFEYPAREPKRAETSAIATKEKVHEVKEQQDVKQGKLNIGYRTNVLYGDADYFALQVFNGIFGGFSHSKLFINVREKASLAYYAASRIESHKGMLMVMSGIDINHYDQALNIIHEQMEAMRKGDITEQEFMQTKAVIENQLLETIDTARGLIEVLYHNVVAKSNVSLDEWIEKTHAVTVEDVVTIAKKVELDTVYFLTGMEASQ